MAFDTGYQGKQISLKFAGFAHCIRNTIWACINALHLTFDLYSPVHAPNSEKALAVSFVTVKSFGIRAWLYS